jgi:hypothetical protein
MLPGQGPHKLKGMIDEEGSNGGIMIILEKLTKFREIPTPMPLQSPRINLRFQCEKPEFNCMNYGTGTQV